MSEQSKDSLQAPVTCPDCDHQYANGECVGPPTPSDVWAGVGPGKCDCDGACAESYVTPLAMAEREMGR